MGTDAVKAMAAFVAGSPTKAASKANAKRRPWRPDSGTVEDIRKMLDERPADVSRAVCAVCHEGFSTTQKLKRHLSERSELHDSSLGVSQSVVYVCHVCLKPWTDPEAIANHVIAHIHAAKNNTSDAKKTKKNDSEDQKGSAVTRLKVRDQRREAEIKMDDSESCQSVVLRHVKKTSLSRVSTSHVTDLLQVIQDQAYHLVYPSAANKPGPSSTAPAGVVTVMSQGGKSKTELKSPVFPSRQLGGGGRELLGMAEDQAQQELIRQKKVAEETQKKQGILNSDQVLRAINSDEEDLIVMDENVRNSPDKSRNSGQPVFGASFVPSVNNRLGHRTNFSSNTSTASSSNFSPKIQYSPIEPNVMMAPAAAAAPDGISNLKITSVHSTADEEKHILGKTKRARRNEESLLFEDTDEGEIDVVGSSLLEAEVNMVGTDSSATDDTNSKKQYRATTVKEKLRLAHTEKEKKRRTEHSGLFQKLRELLYDTKCNCVTRIHCGNHCGSRNLSHKSKEQILCDAKNTICDLIVSNTQLKMRLAELHARHLSLINQKKRLESKAVTDSHLKSILKSNSKTIAPRMVQISGMCGF